jgi:hypothetical protein
MFRSSDYHDVGLGRHERDCREWCCMERFRTELANRERRESYRRLSAPVETNTNFKVLTQREGVKTNEMKGGVRQCYSTVTKNLTAICIPVSFH